MKTKKYVEYMVEETKKILAIDSPERIYRRCGGLCDESVPEARL